MQTAIEKKRLLTGLLLSLVTVFISSTIAAVGKHVSQDVHVSAIVLVQYGISFLFALPSVMKAGRQGILTSRPRLHLIRGVSGCACFYLYYVALSKISLVEASLLRSSAPLMVPLVIFVWFSQRVRKEAWPPLVIGFVGVMLVLKPGFADFSQWHVLALLSALGLAVSMVSTRVLAQHEPQNRILFYYFSISLLVSLPFYFWNGQAIPTSAWPSLLYMGVASYLCFVMYTLAYRYVSASALAPISYFGVVFSGLLDWLIWEHIPDTLTFIGIACVVMGGVLVLRHKEAPAPS
ncbi:Riboflavin transporter [Zhongshania aliphaticivorans]|uniref:Riboflavin transporter n=1 Tax=Zhongshania aliphaticivorans TaxID=1470434 RepID=A0A5S9PYQ4_9GAMM|nr:DMT family transporter [Zhongshania aliphaticivorans]CAA0109847.1 Riboflavin transporter [Zhongshania aliphaticivorans]CAA0117925.1 Riboflavin transporter [Zhongshania aliphaticivorans]CAA0121697.1 Riboflavin transporter [Zhongshania aliphaticivorans]